MNPDYDILYYIFDNYINFDDIEPILFINKYFFENFIKKYNDDLLYTRQLISSKLSIFLINLFSNNILKMKELNELIFSDRFIDITGCIKNIELNDINDSIMYSYDHYGNSFLIIKLNININNARLVQTPIIIYQKHSIHYRWCIDSIDPYFTLFFNRIIQYKDIILLTDLIGGSILKINNCTLWI